MGSHSVIPSTIPRTITLISSKMSIISPFLTAYISFSRTISFCCPYAFFSDIYSIPQPITPIKSNARETWRTSNIKLLFTPFSVTRFAMHRNYSYYIISCVDCLEISMHKCIETPRGILPVNSNNIKSTFSQRNTPGKGSDYFSE